MKKINIYEINIYETFAISLKVHMPYTTHPPLHNCGGGGGGWLGGAKVLGKLPVPGRPTYLDNSRARAYCACGRCGWGLFGHFFLSSIASLFFLPLSGRRPDMD